MKTNYLSDLFNLKEKTFLVSGGAGLLGSQISEALAEFGATVLIASRNLDNCQKMAEKLVQKFGGKSQGYQVDISNSESIRELSEKLKYDGHVLDGLINCSGFGRKTRNRFQKKTGTDIDVSLNGPFRMVKMAFADLKKHKGWSSTLHQCGLVTPARMYDGRRQSAKL